MTTESDAYFARVLLEALRKHHPECQVETVKGRRIGAGAMRVIQVKYNEGKYVQFPFPPKGLHAGAVHDALYRAACRLLMLTPMQVPA